MKKAVWSGCVVRLSFLDLFLSPIRLSNYGLNPGYLNDRDERGERRD